MQIDDVLANALDQERGRDLKLIAPWDGSPTGMVLTIVGPDSETARKADLAFADELAELADDAGRISAEHRARARINALARRVIRWDVNEDGKPIPCTHKNVVRLLSIGWVREQVDAFAGNHRQFAPEA